ncbi:g3136 [Coccomyxa elongata]
MHFHVCLAEQRLQLSPGYHTSPTSNRLIRNWACYPALAFRLQFRSTSGDKAAKAGRLARGSPKLVHVLAKAAPTNMGPDRKAAVTGQVLILYSALTCASTPVALRYLYLQPHPPASPVLAAVQTGFAAVIMCVISGGLRLWKGADEDGSDLAGTSDDEEWQRGHGKESNDQGGIRRRGSDTQGLLERNGSSYSALSVESAVLQDSSSEGRKRGMVGRMYESARPAMQPLRRLGGRLRRPLAGVLNSRAKSLRWAGAELGLLAFLANSVMIYGFMFTTIAKGAFLIRASIIFTPLLCTVAGETVPAALWAGSLLGFAGSVMISLDPSHAASSSSGGPSMAAPLGLQPEVWGDLVLVASASLWSMVMVRQSRHAPDYPPFQLGTFKVMTMAVLSLGWLGTAAIGKLQQGDAVVSLWEGYHDPLAWLVLLWPAIGQYSTGEAAQVAGQARISASAGQVILAMDPVISILLGLLVNRDETQMGPLGWAGGATLMGACILASFYARREH